LIYNSKVLGRFSYYIDKFWCNLDNYVPCSVLKHGFIVADENQLIVRVQGQ